MDMSYLLISISDLSFDKYLS